MGRVVLPVGALVILAATSGCGVLGLYQSAGHLPGIAVTDYAFYFWLFRLSSGRKHVQKSPETSGMHGESGFFRAPAGIEIQPSAVKEDGRLQMTPIPEAIGVFFIV